MWMSVKTVNKRSFKEGFRPYTLAVKFLKQVRTNMQNIKSKCAQMWISVKTVNNDHLRRNSDLKHMPLGFLSR